MTQRTDRVDELLRQEIGAILAREIADPRVGFATITDVETAPDLRHAKVWVSVIGTEPEREAALRALRHAMPFVRHQLGGRLRIRRIPELHLVADDSVERGSRVLRLLQELEAGTEPGGEASDVARLPTPVARLPRPGDAPEAPAGPGDDPETRPRPVEPPSSRSRPQRRRGGHRPARPGAGRS